MTNKKRNKPAERKKKLKKSPNAQTLKDQKFKNDQLVYKWYSDRKTLIAVIGILVLVFFSFFPILNNDFTNWDDKLYVTENSLITDLSLSGIYEIFNNPVVSNYHPVTILSLALNYQISGLQPFSYFSLNLLLHLLNTFLVFLFIYKLTNGKKSIAIIVSLFFGIHPMHVESVAWISERKDLLYTFFLLWGFLIYLNYLKKPSIKKYIGIFILLVLSLLSKPAAVVFPVLLVLIDYFKERSFSKLVIVEKIPFFVIAIIMGVVTFQIQSEKAMLVIESFDLTERFLISCYGLNTYIAKLFYPFPLSALHPFPEAGNLPIIYKLSPIITFIIFGVAYNYRRNKSILFGLLFYIVSIALVLQFITIGNAVIAERYTYVPYVGLFFILGFLYYKLENKKITFLGGINAIRTLIGGAALFLITLTFQRANDWENSETLWSDVISDYPDSHQAFMCRGVYYFDNKQYDLAINDFTQSLTLLPNYKESLEFRGRSFQLLKKNNLAFSDFDQWVKIDPNNKNAYAFRGQSSSTLNKVDEALNDFNISLGMDPNNVYALNNRGTLYFNKKRDYQKALNDFNNVIKIDPNYGIAYLNRSRCYLMLNDKIKALEEAEQAQKLGQTVSADYMNRLK